MHRLPVLFAACAFQVPSYEWDQRLPKMRKCDMFFDRQNRGLPTACAAACPTGASKCGDRTALVAEAQQRIADKPGEYYGRIYGIQEVGGSSVLYLSAVPFEQIGLCTNVPQEPLLDLTWRVLELVPDVVMTGSVLLGGIWWITNRPAEVAQAERNAEEKAEGKRK
jgi:formate dehydrogenase iron-sulfur subunit